MTTLDDAFRFIKATMGERSLRQERADKRRRKNSPPLHGPLERGDARLERHGGNDGRPARPLLGGGG